MGVLPGEDAMASPRLTLSLLLVWLQASNAILLSSAGNSTLEKRSNAKRDAEEDGESFLSQGNQRYRSHKYYGRGYDVLPESNGCGGVIEARPGYQYGQLVSPNWPLPYPGRMRCEWTLKGFDHVVMQFSHLKMRHTMMNCTVDNVTIYAVTDGSEPRIVSCVCGKLKNLPMFWRFKVANLSPGEDLIVVFESGDAPAFHGRLRYKRRRTFTLTGFILTWLKFPEFTSVGPMVTGYSLPVLPGKPAYIVHMSDENQVLEGMVKLSPESSLILCSNVDVFLLSFGRNKRKRLTNQFCPQGQLWIQLVSEKVKAHEPWVIEIREPTNTSPFDIYLDDLQMTSENHTNDWCPYVGESFTSLLIDNTTATYLDNQQCDGLIRMSTRTVKGFFIHFQFSSLIEESPSCVYDYLLVGGRRLCGYHRDDRLVSPDGNRLWEHAGGRYINILDNKMTVTALRQDPKKGGNKMAPLNDNLSHCYWAKPGRRSAFWRVDLEAQMEIVGVSIVKGGPDSENLIGWEVVAYIDRSYRPKIPCWSGNLQRKPVHLIQCNATFTARVVEIRNEFVRLILCRVQVFINAAEPNRERMVVKGGMVTITSKLQRRANYSLPHKDYVRDGDVSTCLMVPEDIQDPIVRVNLGRDYHVVGVRIITDLDVPEAETVVPRYFDVLVYTHLKEFIPWGMGIRSREKFCRRVQLLFEDNTYISCKRTIKGKYVALEQRRNKLYICEMLVYALNREFKRDNVALHKPGEHDTESAYVDAALFTDARLETCVDVYTYVYVDLQQFYVIRRVFIDVGSPDVDEFDVRILSERPNGNQPLGGIGRRQCLTKAYDRRRKRIKLMNCQLLVVGRYVVYGRNMTVTSTEERQYVSVCEVQVLAVPYDREGLVNVALYKHARLVPRTRPLFLPLSPDLGYSGHLVERSARLLVDGVTDSSQPSLTCFRMEITLGRRILWWVDLANMFEVHSVQLAACQSASASLQVIVSNHLNPAQFQDAIFPPNTAICATAQELSDGSYLPCREPALGRYVSLRVSRLTSEGRAYFLCLCEVQVFAKPLTTLSHFGTHLLDPSWDHEDERYYAAWRALNLGFTSDNSITRMGYIVDPITLDLEFDFITFTDCGEMIVSSESGSIYSPNYPNAYAGQSDYYICQWLIPTRMDGFTVLWGDLDLGASTEICEHDFLLISNQAGQQRVICMNHTQLALSFQTFRNSFLSLTLMVRSPIRKKDVNGNYPWDRSIKTGFNISFASYPACSDNIIPIGEENMRGDFSSPLFSEQKLPPDAWCRWTLQILNGGILSFLFNQFAMPGGEDCTQNNLTILGADLEEIYCEANPPPEGEFQVPVEEGDSLVVIFQTTDVESGNGFLLEYTLTP